MLSVEWCRLWIWAPNVPQKQYLFIWAKPSSAKDFFCVYSVWRWLSKARQWMNVLKKMKKKCCLDSLTWEHGYCNYYNNCTQQLCFWWVVYSAGHTWPTCHLQSRSLMIVLILMNHPTKLFIIQHLISCDVVLCKGSFNLKRTKIDEDTFQLSNYLFLCEVCAHWLEFLKKKIC